MGKPLVGDLVVLPFPQSNLQSGKRRPALVVADLAGDDLILCQVTSQVRRDGHAVPITNADLDRGQLSVASFARSNRLFTVEQSVILYVMGRVTASKLTEVRAAIRALFA